jgi:hypothetical protein
MATAWSAVRPRVAPGLAVAGAVVLASTMVEGRRVPVLYRSSLLTLQRRKSGLQMEEKGSAVALWRVLFSQTTITPTSAIFSVVQSRPLRTVPLQTTMEDFSTFKQQMSMTLSQLSFLQSPPSSRWSLVMPPNNFF